MRRAMALNSACAWPMVARLQAGDDTEVVGHALLGAQFRDRPWYVKVARQRLPEIGSEHTDHGVWLAVHDEGSSDDPRVRSEAALPEPIGEDGHRKSRFACALGRRKGASENRASAEHRKEIRGHAQTVDLLGLAIPRHSASADFE